VQAQKDDLSHRLNSLPEKPYKRHPNAAYPANLYPNGVEALSGAAKASAPQPQSPIQLMNTPLPARKGTYLLIVRLLHPTRLQIGKLGAFDLQAGRYAYAGSALGTGGLAARLAHHQRHHRSLHWHIDYLLCAGVPEAVWYVELSVRLECVWAGAVAALPGASRPIPRFGASDCLCPGHLIGLPPASDDFLIQTVLANTLPTPSIQVCRLIF